MVSESTLAKFGIEDRGIKLAGGQETTMKFGYVVVKPVDDESHATFSAEIFDSIEPEGYRISKPVKSVGGKYVEDGFVVSKFEEGKHDYSRIDDMLKISERLHNDLRRLDYDAIPKFDNCWAKAQNVIWEGEELPGGISGSMKQFCEELLSELKSLDLPKQLIHSDLSGNILFHDKLTPLVIDYSPAYAPYEYASALIVCDNIAWNDADMANLNLLKKYGIEDEVVKYAVVFRILVSAIQNVNNPDGLNSDWCCFEPIWNKVMKQKEN